MGFLEFGRDALLASRALVLSEGLLIGPPNADRTTRPWAMQFGVCGVGLITIDGKNVRLALYFEQHSNINRIELQSMGDFPVVREAVLTVFGDLPWMEDVDVVPVNPGALQANPGDAAQGALGGRLGAPVSWGSHSKGFLTAGHIAPTKGTTVARPATCQGFASAGQ